MSSGAHVAPDPSCVHSSVGRGAHLHPHSTAEFHLVNPEPKAVLPVATLGAPAEPGWVSSEAGPRCLNDEPRTRQEGVEGSLLTQGGFLGRAGRLPKQVPKCLEIAGEDGRGVFLVFRDWGQGEGRAQAGRDSCGSNVSQA